MIKLERGHDRYQDVSAWYSRNLQLRHTRATKDARYLSPVDTFVKHGKPHRNFGIPKQYNSKKESRLRYCHSTEARLPGRGARVVGHASPIDVNNLPGVELARTKRARGLA